MNREDIIRMAREAGIDPDLWNHTDAFERLAHSAYAAGVAAEREAWRNAAIRVGENLASCGPAGYYDFTSQQWLDWALNVTSKMQDDYMQLGACGEREACAELVWPKLKIWSAEEQEAMAMAFNKAQEKHGWYETLMAVGASVLKMKAAAIRARGQGEV